MANATNVYQSVQFFYARIGLKGYTMAADQLLSITTIDVDGRSRTDTLFFPPAATLADIQTYATGYIPILDDAVGGVIDSAQVTLNLALPGPLKGAAVAGVDNRIAGLITFDNGSRFKYGHYFRGLLPGLFAGDNVDMADILVVALVNALQTGIAGVAPSNGYGFDVGAPVSNKKSLLK